MICSIDPAFKKCAIVLLDPHTQKIIHAENHSFIGADKQKTNQTQYTVDLWQAIHTKIKQIHDDYSPDCWVIEAQIGQFACFTVQAIITIAIKLCNPDSRIYAQSPKTKLNNSFGSDFQPDATTKQYNQNKNRGVAYATAFLKQSGQSLDLDRDIADAILQGLSFIAKNPFAKSFPPRKQPETPSQFINNPENTTETQQ